MLNIFYGRENVRKDKFIFDSIQGKTLLLVPDQFTLQAERDAFKFLGVKGLMDVEIVSISRLGSKVLAETGGGSTPMIDKYGRHMLITKILKEHGSSLQLYRGMERKQSFIDMMNNFISELKQYGAGPETLREIASQQGENSFMKKKLEDTAVVFEKYQQQIEDKYIDTEDYVSLYADKIPQSEKIRSSSVWIYGFDAFTPKNLEVIGKILETAKEVNIVLTGCDEGADLELFRLFRLHLEKFKAMAQEADVQLSICAVPEEYAMETRKKGIETIEQQLYAMPPVTSDDAEGVTIVKAAGFYNEAETAAAKVKELVRDKGLKYNEIILICNDLETRGTIAKRVFNQYGMDLFLDKKQNIVHQPASVFILSLLELAGGKYSTETIFRLLKTDFTDLEWNQVEELENYARKYKINGRRWTTPFKKGTAEYGEEIMAQLEDSRSRVTDMINEFTGRFNEGETVEEKVRILYTFLEKDCSLPEKLQQLMDRQEQQGFLEASSETAQVWGLIVDLLDQFVEVVGQEKLLAEDFASILKSGMEAIEVGLLPPTADGLVMGTMQRTRSTSVKAMLVMGANEGLLPAAAESNSILSEDEKNALAERDIEICKVEEIRRQEEKMAVYKNFSKPTELLWLSYSVSDEEGKEIKPSQLIMTLKEIFPALEEKEDIVTGEAAEDLLQTGDSAKEHLTDALRAMAAGGQLDPLWKLALGWYLEKDELGQLVDGFSFTGKKDDISREFVDKLYKYDFEEDLKVSPSRLEKYSRCPFAHFVQYGLKPEEQRVFEVGSREIGDVYHECFMYLSQWLTDPDLPVTDKDSRWMTVTREECDSKISEILDSQFAEYREGVMEAGKEEQYRSGRLKEICSDISWILVDHVRRGKIRSMAFEHEFGKGGDLPPVTVETDLGNVQIYGKIDRIDILEDDRVKVIDYKTGNEKFSAEEARKGYRLQLMLYLKAAAQQDKKPAGVFYFLVNEPSVSAADVSDVEDPAQVETKLKRDYRMDGVLVNGPGVVEAVAGDFEGYSDIVKIRKSGKGISGTSPEVLMEEGAFDLFQEQVDDKVKEICRDLLAGKTPARPKKTVVRSACTYCGFKGICQFDTAFEDCNFELI